MISRVSRETLTRKSLIARRPPARIARFAAADFGVAVSLLSVRPASTLRSTHAHAAGIKNIIASIIHVAYEWR